MSGSASLTENRQLGARAPVNVQGGTNALALDGLRTAAKPTTTTATVREDILTSMVAMIPYFYWNGRTDGRKGWK